MLLRTVVAVIGLVLVLVATPVPLEGQHGKDIEIRPGGVTVFDDGMALNISVQNKAKKPVWVMFDASGPPTANTCRTVRKLEPKSTRLFQCPQPSILSDAAYPLGVAVYGDEKFGTPLAWFSGSIRLTEKDLEFVRTATKDQGINKPTPSAETGDDAAPSPPLPAAFEGTTYRVPPDLSFVGKQLKSGIGSMFSKGFESGSLTVEADALTFKSEKQTLRIRALRWRGPAAGRGGLPQLRRQEEPRRYRNDAADGSPGAPEAVSNHASPIRRISATKRGSERTRSNIGSTVGR